MTSHNDLLVLHHLKRYGPLKRIKRGHSIINDMAAELGMKTSTLKYILRKLEKQCIVLRTYEKPQSHSFSEGANNPLIKLELVDPNMELQAIPQVYRPLDPPRPLPLAATMERENRELEERVEQQHSNEPTVESIIEALIDRALELQKQVDKLHDVVDGLTQENERLRKAATPKPAHLSSRVRDVLAPDVWDNLRRQQ